MKYFVRCFQILSCLSCSCCRSSCPHICAQSLCVRVVFLWLEPVCRMDRLPSRAKVMQSVQSLATDSVCPGGVRGQRFDVVVSCLKDWSYCFSNSKHQIRAVKTYHVLCFTLEYSATSVSDDGSAVFGGHIQN